MVSTQAIIMSFAMFQLTADVLRAAPTPTIAPLMVCVVETGMPKPVARNKVIEPAVSAHTPCNGVRRVIRDLIARTIRHPPKSVPSAIASWQLSTTQSCVASA